MPQINSNSLRIHQRMVTENRDVRRGRKNRVVVGGKGTHEDPGHEEEVFRPKINARSRKVPVDQGDAFSRLYDSAMKSKARRDSRERHLIDQHVKGVAGVGSAQKAGRRARELSSRGAAAAADSPRTQARFDASLSAISGVLSADPGSVLHASPGDMSSPGGGVVGARGPQRVSTVEYEPSKMAFIFDLFATRWPLQQHAGEAGGAQQYY